MFSSVEVLAYNCDVSEAYMHLRKAKKELIAAMTVYKNRTVKQAVINDFFSKK